MKKSRVEKNKKLYDQIDTVDSNSHGLNLDAFELEDLGDVSDKEKDSLVIEDLADLSDKEKDSLIVEDLGDIADKEKDAFVGEDLADVADQKSANFNISDLGDLEETFKDIKAPQVEEVSKKEAKKSKKVPMVKEDNEFSIEQPVSYNKLLKAEEILRAKFERQKELIDQNRGHKRSPVTDTYTAEMMQKNINQHTGVDVRKELNIKIRKSNGRAIAMLSILLVAIVAIGVAISIVILRS